MNKDLILIGMPGSGKTSLGRRLAKKLHRPFVDVDQEIEKTVGKTVTEIFATEGEDGFRRWETQIFASLVRGGRVIATGGGVVTRQENYAIAKRGTVLFIDRPLNLLMQSVQTDTRPLLRDGAERLRQLYAERYESYCRWADIRILNQGSFVRTLHQMIQEVEKYENHGN